MAAQNALNLIARLSRLQRSTSAGLSEAISFWVASISVGLSFHERLDLQDLRKY